MKRAFVKTFAWAVVVVVIAASTGCEEHTSDTRKSRLVAAENIRLEEQLQQYEKQLQKQKEELGECQQAKEALKKQDMEQTKELVNTAFKKFGEENARLKEENEKLKEQIEQLKKQLEEIKQSGGG